VPRLASPLPLTAVGWAALLVLLAGFAVSSVRVALEIAALRRMLADAFPVALRRRLSVLSSSSAAMPFSLWTPWRRYVVLPQGLLLQADVLRIALRHELQHHRQGDTWTLYPFELLRAAFAWHPGVWLLVREVRELQELACDEAVLARGRISAQEYCHGLLAAAEHARSHARAGRTCAVLLGSGMAAGRPQSLLRRVRAALAPVRLPAGPRATRAVLAAALVLMGGLAMAAAQPIADRRVGLPEAQALATDALRRGGIEIPLNDAVLQELNLLLGTPAGRAGLEAARARLPAFEALLRARLAADGLPAALLAVPLVESGYRNLPQGADPRHGAGLWMFIAPTARRFGLEVSATRDERLDVAAQTAAAARYLAALYQQFGDWPLALLAYNAGARRVEEAIAATGSRDAWQLVARGHENDPDYLPRVFAAMLALHRPEQ
jgi:hypothetical protein